MHVVFATTLNVNLFNYCVTPFAPVQPREITATNAQPHGYCHLCFCSIFRLSVFCSSQISTQIDTHTHTRLTAFFPGLPR